jgi:hypothetical protein
MKSTVEKTVTLHLNQREAESLAEVLQYLYDNHTMSLKTPQFTAVADAKDLLYDATHRS